MLKNLQQCHLKLFQKEELKEQLKQLVVWMVIKLLKKLTKSSTDLPQSSSETVESETKNTEFDRKKPKERYISSEKRHLWN